MPRVSSVCFFASLVFMCVLWLSLFVACFGVLLCVLLLLSRLLVVLRCCFVCVDLFCVYGVWELCVWVCLVCVFAVRSLVV